MSTFYGTNDNDTIEGSSLPKDTFRVDATNLDLVGLAQTGVEYVLSVSSVAKALDLKFFTLRIM